jgi:hypothetical protein
MQRNVLQREGKLTGERGNIGRERQTCAHTHTHTHTHTHRERERERVRERERERHICCSD